MHSVVRQLSKFSLVGVAGTALHYGVLVLAVELFMLGAVLASMLGAIAGALCNYGLNYRFTFASAKSHAVALPQFLVVAAIGFALNGVLMWGGVELLQLHYMLAQVLTTLVVLGWNFFASRVWVFA